MKKILWNALEAFVLFGTLTAVYFLFWILSMLLEVPA